MKSKDRPGILTEVKESKFGKGLFAGKDIPAGTVICAIHGPLLTFRDTVEVIEEESYSLQIGMDQYLYCNFPFIYMNHSCIPNCGITPDMNMITLQRVSKGDELCWDYSTSMLERHWTMECACGTSACRKLITDFDLLPQQLQTKYLQCNIVLPFIVHFLQYQHAKRA